jgi:hypothetical protein
MSDLPLGFGVAAKATAECRHADPMHIVAFHQVIIGILLDYILVGFYLNLQSKNFQRLIPIFFMCICDFAPFISRSMQVLIEGHFNTAFRLNVAYKL